jgi:hypothetical protein
MNVVPQFVRDYCPYLIERYHARVVDGSVSGPNEHLDLSIDNLLLRITMDRKQLFVRAGAANAKRHEFYSIDLLRTLLTGEIRDYALLDDDNTDFLEDHLEEIIDAFSAQKAPQTLQSLEQLARERWKRMKKENKRRIKAGEPLPPCEEWQPPKRKRRVE